MSLPRVLSTLFLVPALLAVQACSSSDSPGGGGGGGGSGGQAGTPQGGSAGGGSGGTASGGSGGTASGGAGAAGTASDLAAKYQALFPIGIALSKAELTPDQATIAANFKHLTCGNAMKSGVIHPAENTWNTSEADALAEFARAQGWKMTGHTMVWHQQQASWFFQGLTAGDAASIETLKGRLKAHIEYMVDRYGDVVDNWDVVNEAISDDTSATNIYRTTSDWYKYFGSEDYIYWAFKYTYDALEAKAAGSAKGKLYYNDYNETLKIDNILKMADWLKGKGVTLDGIGFQSHHRMDWPSVAEIEGAINKVVAAGYKVKISELDITLYNDYPAPSYSYQPADQVEFTADLEAKQADRYDALFAMFRDHAADITSVTVWGFSDDNSWLNDFPKAGRRNYPLLFNDAHQPKKAYFAIKNF